MILFCFFTDTNGGEFPTGFNKVKPHTQPLCISSVLTKLKITPAILSTQENTRSQTLAQMGKLITWAGEGEFEWTVAPHDDGPM